MPHLELESDSREAILLGAVVWGVLVAVLTELLSALGWVTFGSLLLAWATVLAALVFLAVRRLPVRGARPLRTSLRTFLRSQSGLEVVMEAWITIVVVLSGVLAVFAVPATFDSMTYHLARVVHWAQNHSVAFYATPIQRQLYQPPWAEFAVLHLFVLAGSDRLANLVQWGSMVGSVIGVSLIARQLGATVRGQVLSGFVCATIPMGIVQSSSTQNDYVAAFWLVCLVHALLALEAHRSPTLALTAGASLGLAVLTKGTANVFAAPFLLFFLIKGRGRSLSRKLGQGLGVLLVLLALNGPHYLRNFDVFGSILGPGGEGDYTYVNREFSLPVLVSNVLRNLGLHLGTPWRTVNALVEHVITAADSAMGIAPDDPRNTWPVTRFAVGRPVAHEDLAGSGLHLLLVVGAALAGWRLRPDGRVKGYVGCLVVAFLLFCLLLRWQPWHSRLQLPLFVLAAPVVGVLWQRVNAKLLAAVLLMFAASSWYFLTGNKTQPFTGPRAVLGMTRADQRAAHAGPAYVGATRFVKATGCVQLGLVMGSNAPEYLLWALLPEVQGRGRLEHVPTSPPEYGLLPDESARLAHRTAAAFQPCAIIRVADVPKDTLSLGQVAYRSAWSQGAVQVLLPSPGVGRAADFGE